MNRNIIYLIIALLATSCASFNAPLDYKLDPTLNNGLAVFSFTTEGILDNYFLQYRSIQKGPRGDVTLFTNKNPLDWDFQIKGRLVTLELPAGEYEIYRLTGPYVSSARNFSIPFEVISSKAVYFGNVHVEIPDFSEFYTTVLDESQRDLQMLTSRYINISTTDIIKDLSQFTNND